jgi:hypothetical protein
MPKKQNTKTTVKCQWFELIRHILPYFTANGTAYKSYTLKLPGLWIHKYVAISSIEHPDNPDTV